MTAVNYLNKAQPPERNAGLAVRMRMIIQAYGGAFHFAKRFGIPFATVRGWRKIPHTIAPIIHNDRPRIFTATFCRPDLKWNNKGELVSSSRHRKKVYS